MHQPLTPAQVAALNAAESPFLPMTRDQKLARWSHLLKAVYRPIVLGDRLEHLAPERRRALSWSGSAMEVAFADQTLREAGLADATVGEAMRFFELSDDDIHAFSCNCGGAYTSDWIASQVAGFMGRTPPPVVIVEQPSAGMPAAVLWIPICGGGLLSGLIAGAYLLA